MTVPTPDPVTTATGANPQQAADNVADDADKHTPETPVAPPADATTDPTTGEGKDDLRDIVTGLATTVATLTETVNKLANPDSGPHDHLPWALRGKRSL